MDAKALQYDLQSLDFTSSLAKPKIGKEFGRQSFAPINIRLNVVVRFPTPFGLGRNGCWSSLGSQLPRALPWNYDIGRNQCQIFTEANMLSRRLSFQICFYLAYQNWFALEFQMTLHWQALDLSQCSLDLILM